MRAFRVALSRYLIKVAMAVLPDGGGLARPYISMIYLDSELKRVHDWISRGGEGMEYEIMRDKD